MSETRDRPVDSLCDEVTSCKGGLGGNFRTTSQLGYRCLRRLFVRLALFSRDDRYRKVSFG
jgi:hypothetical protein